MKRLPTTPAKLVLSGGMSDKMHLFVVGECLKLGERFDFTYNGEGKFKAQSIGTDGFRIEWAVLRRRIRKLLQTSARRRDRRQRVEVERITPPPSPPQHMHEVIEISSNDFPPRPVESDSDSNSGSESDVSSYHQGPEPENVQVDISDGSLCIKKLTGTMISIFLMYVPKAWNLGLPTDKEKSKIWFTIDRVTWFGVTFVYNSMNRCFSAGFGDFLKVAGFEKGHWL